MKFTLSKSQWESVGKNAGWMKEAGVQSSQNAEVQKIAIALNNMVGKMLPDTASQARGLVNQLTALFDADIQRQQGLDAQTPAAQAPAAPAK